MTRPAAILLLAVFLGMLAVSLATAKGERRALAGREEAEQQAVAASRGWPMSPVAPGALLRPANARRSYPVDWRRRYLAEHAHVQRLLAEKRARRWRTLQVHEDWRSRQIAAAETIARESAGDPWPNCPDPYDGSGATWDDTVQCENRGSWLDSPGYYRCGLQFDPMWEARFGRLCP